MPFYRLVQTLPSRRVALTLVAVCGFCAPAAEQPLAILAAGQPPTMPAISVEAVAGRQSAFSASTQPAPAPSGNIDSPRLGAHVLRVAVAANFRVPFDALAGAFTEQHGIALSPTFGSSGLLAAQIRQGAPYDAYFSADTMRPQALIADGLAAAPVTIYARGRVALRLVAPARAREPSTTHRIGLPNPKLAPYGVAARQCLQKLGVWRQLQGRLVFGNNVNQVDHFLESGALQLGFVALSQLIAKDIPAERYWICPSAFHAPIDQGAVALLRGSSTSAAQLLLSFMTVPATQERLTQMGYRTSGKSR